LEAAERWLELTAKSEARLHFSHASTGLLVARDIVHELKGKQGSGIPALPPLIYHDDAAATDKLANDLRARLEAKLSPYGLAIERADLQDARLPKELHQAAVDACRSLFALSEAERKAKAEEVLLRAATKVIGKEVVGLRELVRAGAGRAPTGVPQLLDTLFGILGELQQQVRTSQKNSSIK
jgi:hypothetical protein